MQYRHINLNGPKQSIDLVDLIRNGLTFFYFQSDNFPKSSEEIIAEWKINPIEMNYTEDEYRTLTTYRLVFIHLLWFFDYYFQDFRILDETTYHCRQSVSTTRPHADTHV